MRFSVTAPVLAISLAALLTLGACSETPKQTTRVTNSDLEQAVKSRLAADERTAKISVSADIDKNQVTLSGTVPSEALRMQAVDIAKGSRPGLSIVDKIDVKPNEVARSEYTEEMARTTAERARAAGNKIGSSLDDAWIYSKIEAKLFANTDVTSRHINVDVENKVVTLRGTVPSHADKEEAERVASSTDGVAKVRNQLRVTAG
jgi:osmotically-inducible protein OsmY